jgi:hypothetical protein
MQCARKWRCPRTRSVLAEEEPPGSLLGQSLQVVWPTTGMSTPALCHIAKSASAGRGTAAAADVYVVPGKMTYSQCQWITGLCLHFSRLNVVVLIVCVILQHCLSSSFDMFVGGTHWPACPSVC